MATASVQNKICRLCGAEIRPNALFCYACGGAVVEEEKRSEKLAFEKSAEIAVKKRETVEKAEAVENIEKVETGKPIAAEEAKLKTAAAMRRKSKSFQSKKVEVVWEEHDNAPNVWFIAAAIFLTIAAGAILFLAIYLK